MHRYSPLQHRSGVFTGQSFGRQAGVAAGRELSKHVERICRVILFVEAHGADMIQGIAVALGLLCLVDGGQQLHGFQQWAVLDQNNAQLRDVIRLQKEEKRKRKKEALRQREEEKQKEK